MSVKHNRYRVIIKQELSRVDLDMSTDLLIIPAQWLDKLADGIIHRMTKQIAHDILDQTDGDQA